MWWFGQTPPPHIMALWLFEQLLLPDASYDILMLPWVVSFLSNHPQLSVSSFSLGFQIGPCLSFYSPNLPPALVLLVKFWSLSDSLSTHIVLSFQWFLVILFSLQRTCRLTGESRSIASLQWNAQPVDLCYCKTEP